VSVILVGLSHRTAPVAVRERHAVPAAASTACNAKLAHKPGLHEAAILSTCNRTELLAVADDDAAAQDALVAFLRDEIGDGTLLPAQTYALRDGEAVAHVFRVASSLDAMVVGEAQILGQLKDAWRAASAAGTLGPVLHRLLQRAFRAAKRVRAETGLGGASVSLARVGVALAREIFETFEGKLVLLVGAGEMAESALRGLVDAGARQVTVVNRSVESARRLAERTGGRALPLDALEAELARADVALVSLAVERPLLVPSTLAPVMARRQGRPLLLVDLGLPRNVDPAVNALRDVYLYNLDALDAIAERGRAARAAEIPRAEAIVADECARFERWRAGLEAVPTIRALVARGEAVAHAEVERALERAPAGVDRAVLERLASGIVARLLHTPLERLRAEAEEGSGAYIADAFRELLGLDSEEDA
jgi:glutamyl-tRNA reductase